jgi:hypothetical protein
MYREILQKLIEAGHPKDRAIRAIIEFRSILMKVRHKMSIEDMVYNLEMYV